MIMKGVTFKDLMDSDILSSFYKHNTSLARTVKCDIPKQFCGVSSWPTHTDLKCWFCDRVPTSYPKFLPRNPKQVDGEPWCEPIGNFCEWSCVVSHVYDKYRDEHTHDLIALICIFENVFSGCRKTHIPRSPEKTEMIAYCGSAGITEKEYDEKITRLKLLYSSGTKQ